MTLLPTTTTATAPATAGPTGRTTGTTSARSGPGTTSPRPSRSADDDLVRKTVRAELEAIDNYGGDCRGCGTPIVKGRTYCRTCEEAAEGEDDECEEDCERNCCWEATVARRHARDAAHQTDTCPNCGNCRTCEDPESPDHEDCICEEAGS